MRIPYKYIRIIKNISEHYLRVRRLLVEILTEIVKQKTFRESFNFFQDDDSGEHTAKQLLNEDSELSKHISDVHQQMSDLEKHFFKREKLSTNGWQPSDTDITTCISTNKEDCTTTSIRLDGKDQGLTLDDIEFFELCAFANDYTRTVQDTPAQRVMDRRRQSVSLYRQFVSLQ